MVAILRDNWDALVAVVRGATTQLLTKSYCRLPSRGRADAQFSLGVMYANGDGVP